jgi:hypothetical protein
MTMHYADDDVDSKKMILEEIMSMAKAGMAKGMRKSYGKMRPGDEEETAEDDAPNEDQKIPGVPDSKEKVEGIAVVAKEGKSSLSDDDLLALLEKLKELKGASSAG